jgi:hypothetical protein
LEFDAISFNFQKWDHGYQRILFKAVSAQDRERPSYHRGSIDTETELVPFGSGDVVVLPLGTNVPSLKHMFTELIVSQGFSYGLLDTLNKHFQLTLHITRTRSSGLQAAYFG